jgi:hypothetical protein
MNKSSLLTRQPACACGGQALKPNKKMLATGLREKEKLSKIEEM